MLLPLLQKINTFVAKMKQGKRRNGTWGRDGRPKSSRRLLREAQVAFEESAQPVDDFFRRGDPAERGPEAAPLRGIEIDRRMIHCRGEMLSSHADAKRRAVMIDSLFIMDERRISLDLK